MRRRTRAILMWVAAIALAIAAVGVPIYLEWGPDWGSSTGYQPDIPANLPSTPRTTQPAAPTFTFHRDIVPILAEHCTACHHPGESVPFALVAYGDVQKRAPDILKAIANHSMPPWLPDPKVCRFDGQRRLTAWEAGILRQWAEQDAPEGPPSAVKPQQPWSDGWQFGKPDLIVKTPEPIALAADEKDIYRTVPIPIDVPDTRWVRAAELHPAGGIRNATILLAPGAHPQGQFLCFLPGKRASAAAEGIAWPIQKGAALQLQLHLLPTGKGESIQPEIGLYFAPGPPKTFPITLALRAAALDIPAGAKDYAVESTYVLPTELDVIAVLPNARRRGKQLLAWATLPDGAQKWLLAIDDWNPDWQEDCALAEPLHLPKGAKLAMRYTFDNSVDNPRNPSNPPKAVRSGANPTDEIAELHLQTLTRKAEDAELLRQDHARSFPAP